MPTAIGPRVPALDDELAKRIRLVRRDVGSLLFHFTRGDPESGRAAPLVLRDILRSRCLRGSDTWTERIECVCFTEAPIQEFAAVFSLNEIAARREERPRYEPYGIAVAKEWLFQRGGRPVIYERRSDFASFSDSQQYRLVPYDPGAGTDFTWEREWRIQTPELELEPQHTLVIVPTANEAFDIVRDFAVEGDWDSVGTTGHADVARGYLLHSWLAVSLDLFGLVVAP